jgi:hypothetical protein
MRELRYQLTPAVSASTPFSAVRPPPVIPLATLPSKKSSGPSDAKSSFAYGDAGSSRARHRRVICPS